MVQTMAKHDKIFTVTILRDMFVTRTNDISASVEFSIRFHSEMFHAKPPNAPSVVDLELPCRFIWRPGDRISAAPAILNMRPCRCVNGVTV